MKNGRFVTETYEWLIYEFEVDCILFKKKVYVAINYRFKSFPKFNTNLNKLIGDLP